jgi:hypothetical protein
MYNNYKNKRKLHFLLEKIVFLSKYYKNVHICFMLMRYILASPKTGDANICKVKLAEFIVAKNLK